MRTRALIVFFVAVLCTAGCEMLGTARTEPGDAVYKNPFETAADIEGWPANGQLELRDEAPKGGGARSAYVAGGCDWPHSAYAFAAPGEGQLALRVWAKNLGVGGSVLLRNETTDEGISVQVQGDGWARFQSDETLAVEAGDELKISMGAGGFVASAMLVTEVTVVGVE